MKDNNKFEHKKEKKNRTGKSLIGQITVFPPEL